MTTKPASFSMRERAKKLDSLLTEVRYITIKPLEKSAEEKAAEKVINKYIVRNSKHKDAQRAKWRRKLDEVNTLVILNDVEKALGLIDKLRAERAKMK